MFQTILPNIIEINIYRVETIAPCLKLRQLSLASSNKRKVGPSAVNAVPVPALDVEECAVNGAEDRALQHHEADEDEH